METGKPVKKCKSYKYLPYTLQCRSANVTINYCKSVLHFFIVFGAVIKCKQYSGITVESGTHVKSVKNTLNIFALYVATLQSASLLSPKISSQIQPWKFETFKIETYFKLIKSLNCQKTNLAGQELFPFWALAMFFQFKNETAFGLNVHLSFKKVKHYHHKGCSELNVLKIKVLVSTKKKAMQSKYTET